ncbi:MAG: ester cyclase [Chloroflexia bacterium]
MTRTQPDLNVRLWTEHVLAENRRDLDRLIDTLADDAVYEIVPMKKFWRGKDEIRRFYTMLWMAIPDVKLDLRSKVADDHYVVEESHVHGTHSGPLFGVPPSNGHIEFDLVIYFPFKDGKIMGERLYLDVNSITSRNSTVASTMP